MADLFEIDLGGEIEYDLDSFLQDFGDGDPGLLPSPEEPRERSSSADGEPWISDSALPSEKSVSPDSDFCWMSEIEKFLLDDKEEEDDGEEFRGDFFSELLAGGLEGREGVVTTPEEADAVVEGRRMEKRAAASAGAEDDDPVSKKRTRQMRNRDSAMKSRERKRMYVKDLQMKSKYLESECRRLDFALRCCVAENLALHQRLQKERPLGALVAKQESAVLFVESLLLGSLFWLVSIVCLFLMPGLPIPNQKDASRLGRGPAQEVVGTKRSANERIGSSLGLELVIMRRRCRGIRTKMKLCLFPLHAIST